jgi:hypothetical protein
MATAEECAYCEHLATHTVTGLQEWDDDVVLVESPCCASHVQELKTWGDGDRLERECLGYIEVFLFAPRSPH